MALRSSRLGDGATRPSAHARVSDIFGTVAVAHATHIQRGRGYAGGLQRVAQFGFSPAVGDHKIRPAEARQVVNRLKSFQLLAGDPGFHQWMARWETVAQKWDEPELDAGFLKAVDRS